MTTQNLVRKWLLYCLVMVPLWLAQVYILPRMPVLGTVPLLFPLSVIAVGNLERPTAAAVYGLCIGVFWFTLTSCSPVQILLCFACALIASLAVEAGLQRRFTGYLALCVPLIFLFLLPDAVPLLFLRKAPAAAVWSLAGKEYLTTLCCTVFVYPLTLLAFRRVGLDRLA